MKQISIITRFLIVVVLLGSIVHFVNFKQLTDSFNSTILLSSIITMSVLLVALLPQAVRLQRLCLPNKLSFFITAKSIVLSLGLNNLLPARISEFVKPIYLRDKASLPFAKGINAMLVERISDIICLAILSLFCVGTNFDFIRWELLGSIALLLATGLYFLPRFEATLQHKMKSLIPTNFGKRVAFRMLNEMCKSVKSGKITMAILTGGVCWGLSTIAVIIFITIAGNGQADIEAGLSFFVFTTFAYMLPSLPAGLGLYEAAGVIALKPFGYSTEEALALSLGLHIAVILPITLGTCIILLTEHIGLNSFIDEIKLSMKSQETIAYD